MGCPTLGKGWNQAFAEIGLLIILHYYYVWLLYVHNSPWTNHLEDQLTVEH